MSRDPWAPWWVVVGLAALAALVVVAGVKVWRSSERCAQSRCAAGKEPHLQDNACVCLETASPP